MGGVCAVLRAESVDLPKFAHNRQTSREPMRAAFTLVLVMASAVPTASVGQTIHLRSESEEKTFIGGQWFINYRVGEATGEDLNRFGVDRGYITIRHQLTDRLSGRITPDVSVDREGDGEGDLELRLKYAFIDYALDDIWIFTQPHVEFGLVHRPWLDFEEHVNYYRVQGTMFLERNHIFNSGDYGFTVFSMFGGQMDEEYRERVNSRYPGRYGSFAIGLYNGGGYHAIEKNTNKSLEARLTLRPLPKALPGLQLSYHGVYGKGNEGDKPDWTVSLLFVGWESPHLVLTGQYYWGKGNMRGTAVDDDGNALRQDGASLFAEMRSRRNGLSLIGRIDLFDDTPDIAADHRRRFVLGAAYYVQGNTKLLLDYDSEKRRGTDAVESRLLKFSVEFAF